MTNGVSHCYHLDESTFIFRCIRSNFSFLFPFFDENRFAASHLGLFCLPMSHKKDARLILVNHTYTFNFTFDNYVTPLLLQAGGSGVRLYDGPDLKLFSFVCWDRSSFV